MKPRAANDPRFVAPPDSIGADPRALVRVSRLVRWILPAAVFTALLAAWHLAGAEVLIGRVVGITDGDGLTVLVQNRQINIRLRDIDAPEAKQAFGTRSRQSLSAICFNKTAELETAGKDRYGRTLATVTCARVDANAEQVRRGMAWVFDRYVSKEAAPQLYALQAEAKAATRGLWADPEPVPPWEWRQQRRAQPR